MKYWRKPLDIESIRILRGNIQILKERCKGCGFCVEYCPRRVLEVSEEFNSKGYHPPYVKDGDGCVSCGLCEMLCPEFAIYRLEEEGEVRYPEPCPEPCPERSRRGSRRVVEGRTL